MKKFLRYSFVALMMMLFSGASATDVVILPSDFTAVTESDIELVKDGVVISVTKGTLNDSQIRVFKSETITIASVAQKISKIVFTCTAEGTAKYGPGCFEGTEGYTFEGSEGTWTGSGQYVMFTAVSNQVRITKIVVTLGEGGSDPTTPDTPTPVIDISLLSKFSFTSGTITDNISQLTVDFTGVANMGETGEQKIDVTGKLLFDFENELCTGCTVTLTFPSEIIAALAEMDAKANAENDGFASVTRDGATLTVVASRDFMGYSRILIKSLMKMVIDNETGGSGELASPMSPNQANILAGSLEKDEASKENVYIKGKISSIKFEFSAEYGTATFAISADGQDDFTFQCYSVYYLENKPWVEGNTQIKVGDEVIICGKVTNYNGTPETASKKAYIYSLNGVTKNEGGNENPDPEIKQISVEDALTIINALEAGKKTDEEYLVEGVVLSIEEISTQYGNATFDIYGPNTKNEATYVPTVKVYRAKGFDNQNITDDNIIKVGDKVVVRGKLQKYVKNDVVTPEVTNCYLVSVTSGQSEETGKVWDFTKWSDATIANLKADAAASKTSGWSDVEKKADAEAGADPTEASKDNCFWLQLEAAPADGALTANGVVIEELKGLLFTEDATATSRNIAIAVNYSVADVSKDFGPYAGGSYLWVGGKDRKFTIPNVAAGSTITMEVESHKITDGRGVKLMQDGNQIGDAFTPKAKESHSWTIENSGDVVVANTNGCHIYKIEVTSGASGIQAVKTATVGNGYIYNLAGQRVDANYKGVVIKNGQKMIQK